jgi:ankyrin repeat protein
MDLFNAVKSRDREAVREVLERSPEAVALRDADGATALHYAAEIGDRDIAALLLKAGAEVNARDGRFGATPAGWAIEYLRQRGGLLAIEIDDAGRAIARGDRALLEQYIARFPALRDAVDREGIPLKTRAAGTGRPEIAQLFH